MNVTKKYTDRFGSNVELSIWDNNAFIYINDLILLENGIFAKVVPLAELDKFLNSEYPL